MLDEHVENTVTEVPDYESGPEYYVESPGPRVWLLSHDPEKRAEGLRRIQETIEREKQEELEHKHEYPVWRFAHPERAAHPDESSLGVKKPLAHGGGYCGLMKCDDERLTEILKGSDW